MRIASVTALVVASLCRGNIVKNGELLVGLTPVEIEAPVSGLISLKRLR